MWYVGQFLFTQGKTQQNVTPSWPTGNPMTLQPLVTEELADQSDWVSEWMVTAVLAILVIVIGWYIAKFAVRLAGRPVAQRFDRPSVTRTILQTIRVSILVVALGVAASLLGFEPSEILLSVTVFSAVLAVVLAPIVGSFISGLFVLADQPFEIGDMIELVDEGTQGYVEDITLRYTKMFTLDNTFIVIPNSTIRERDIVNYSAEDERIRRSIEIVVTYEGDLSQARQAIERAARDVEEVVSGGPDIRVSRIRYPARPTCYIEKFGDHGIHLELRFWVEKPYRLLKVESKVQQNIWDAIAELDVEIAYPHSHVVFDEHSGELPIRTAEAESGRQIDRGPPREIQDSPEE